MAKEEIEMSATERRLSEAVAQTVVARILDAAKDRDTAAGVIEVWSDELDRVIGRSVRRALLWLASAAAIAAAVKLGALEKISGWLK